MAGVPAYITPLSYIRGSGSQYITTEINLRSTDVVKSRWRFENSAGNVYGCFSGSSANDNFCLYAGSASTNAYIRYNGQVVRDFKAANGTIYEIEHGPDGFFANGDLVTSFNDATFECSAPMYIFMLPNSSSAKVTARCYGLTVYRGGEQVCNFIPARNELTGEVGFYESVQGVFYENAGTGAFTAGPEVNFSVKTLLLKRRRALLGGIPTPPPPYDAEVEYLGADNHGQYIDTNFTSQIGDEIECEFLHTGMQPGATYSLFSAGTGASQLIFLSSTVAPGAYYRYFSTGGAVLVMYPNTLGVWYKVVCSGDGKVTVYNGAQYSAQITPTAQLDANTTLFLFLRRNSAAPFHGRIRYFRIKRGGSIVLDLRPVRVGAVGYMYDTVSGQMLGNAGTGAFVVGPDI